MTMIPLPMAVKVRLESTLAESDLPFQVDLLYWDEHQHIPTADRGGVGLVQEGP